MKKAMRSYTTLSVFEKEKYGKVLKRNPTREKQIHVMPIPKRKKIDNDVLEILRDAHTEGVILFLNSQMDRKLYVKTNKVLESLGGQWNRNKKGHIFEDDPQEILDQVLHTGYYEKQEDFGYFPTPKNVVQQILEHAKIEPGNSILEPSAGQGHILDEIPKVIPYYPFQNVKCGELLIKNREVLEQKGYEISFENFLTYTEKFDRIVMTPPFALQADIEHVNHAFELLKPGGRLVSIMSNSVTFRSNKKTNDFRKLIDDNGYYLELPEDSFYTSGTRVRTILVVLNKEDKN